MSGITWTLRDVYQVKTNMRVNAIVTAENAEIAIALLTKRFDQEGFKVYKMTNEHLIPVTTSTRFARIL